MENQPMQPPIATPTPAQPTSPPPMAATPPPTPVMSTPKPASKGWLWALIVTLVLVFGYSAVAYFSGIWPFGAGSEPSPSPSASVSPDETAGWETYNNTQYGFEFRYPNELGQIIDGGKNAYMIKRLSFSADDKTSLGVKRTWISIFTDKSVNDWNTTIQNAINDNEPVGDPSYLPYPLTVKTLLTTESSGYDCTTDFGAYLGKNMNESCQIVTLNGAKVFKIVATGPFQSEVSQMKYLFYENGTWTEFSKSFGIRDKNDKQIYTFEQLNSILQGETVDPTIQAEIVIFNQILSTFRFTEADPTAGWEVYSNELYGYQIKYPEGWTVATAGTTALGLRAPGTLPQPGDFVADVYVTYEPSVNIQNIIDATGSQFPDRRITREDVIIGNRSAVRLTVSTPSYPEWISHSLLVAMSSGVLNVNDGAQNTPEFWQIASTLTFKE